MVKEEVAISRAVLGLVGPKPTVLVTCVDEGGKPNIITIAAVTAASHEPPMFVIAIRHDRYSHQLVERTKEFVINVPTTNLVEQTNLCGRISGRDVDKFKEAKISAVQGKVVKAPLIAECPINIECKVVDSIKPGTHTLYVGQVVAVHVENGAFDEGKLNLEDFPTIGYNQVEYLRPGEVIAKT